MMLQKSDIIGSDLPVLTEKEDGMFTYEEALYLGEDLKNYGVIGFIRIDKDSDEFYEKLYVKL